jgi:hypothetical protein
LGICDYVRNMNRAALKNCTPKNRAAIRLCRITGKMLALFSRKAESRS